MSAEDHRIRKILVADDDPDTQNIVSSIVQVMGFTPCTANDGLAAIEIAKQESLDLAILDFMMPGRTGPEVCKELKSFKGGELTPVLMLTGRDSIQDKVMALEGGVDDYLTKPFNWQELEARIKALLRVRDLTVSLKEKSTELEAMQEKLIEHERHLVVGQLVGTAAHQLGQPLSAILLNCYLLEQLPANDPKRTAAILSIKQDASRMGEMLEQLRKIDPAQKERYHGETEILSIKK